VDRLKSRDQVISSREAGVGRVPHLKGDPVPDPSSRGVATSLLDRGCIEVEAINVNQGIGGRDRDAGPAGAAPDVGHPRGRLRPQAAIHVRDGRKPVVAQEVQERRPVEE
jgi:hypothetical protein